MVDLHNHIVSGIDDGAESFEVSLDMARVASEDGIKTIVATPHIVGEDGCEEIKAKTEAIDGLVDSFTDNPVSVVPGGELMVRHDLADFVGEFPEITLGRTGRYVLVEFPVLALPLFAEQALSDLLARGVVPIIAHVERYAWAYEDADLLVRWARSGVLCQVTANAIAKKPQDEQTKFVKQLIESGLVQIIASDSHSLDRRSPQLSPAVEIVETWIGQYRAVGMVTRVPEKILRGEKVVWDIPPRDFNLALSKADRRALMA